MTNARRIPEAMRAMLLAGHGGIDRLQYRTDVPVPAPGPGEVLVEVTATAKNNTDRKAREGLYPVEEGDRQTSFAIGGEATLTFPRIQGADVVGRVAATGPGVDPKRIGERGLLDFNLYPDDRADLNLAPDYYGHGADGGFAEYVAVPSDQFHAVENPDLADAQLASLGMCSWQTALHMLSTVDVRPDEQVLVTGGTGGVGTALIQLCRLLGARPHVLSRPARAAELQALGAETVLDREAPGDLVERVREATGGAPVDAVMDLLGGEFTDRLIDTMIFDMKRRDRPPRLAIAGAGAGNVSRILWTRIYLYQVQIHGVSHGTRNEAARLVEWIRAGRLRPVLHGTYRLSDLHAAERAFVDGGSDRLGRIVIVPDSQWEVHGAPFALEVPR